MDDLTAFQRDLLYVVSGMDRPHGLGIQAELDDYYEKSVQHGWLYPNLDTLVEEGFVEKGKRDERSNYYTTTDHGEQAIEAREQWLGQYR